MKQTKRDALYVPHASTKHCDTCSYYSAETCSQVQGQINPDASCSLYEKRPGAAKHQADTTETATYPYRPKGGGQKSGTLPGGRSAKMSNASNV